MWGRKVKDAGNEGVPVLCRCDRGSPELVVLRATVASCRSALNNGSLSELAQALKDT